MSRSRWGTARRPPANGATRALIDATLAVIKLDETNRAIVRAEMLAQIDAMGLTEARRAEEIRQLDVVFALAAKAKPRGDAR